MGSVDQNPDLRREMAELTTSLTEAHPKVQRVRAQIEELASAQARERDNILNRLRTAYVPMQGANESFVPSSMRKRRCFRIRTPARSLQMLQREVETYRKIYDNTLQAGKEASLASALRPVNAELIDAARVPAAPSSPNLLRNFAIGSFGGLVFGVAMILIRERTDSSIRQPGTLPQHFNLRELGVIPSASVDAQLSLGAGRRLLSGATAPPALTDPGDREILSK